MTDARILWEERPHGRQAPLQGLLCLAMVFTMLEEDAAFREMLDDVSPDLAPLILELKAVRDGPFSEAMDEWDWAVDLRQGIAHRLFGTPRPLGMDKAAEASLPVLIRMAVALLQFGLALRDDAGKMTAAYDAMVAGKAMLVHDPEHGERVVMVPPDEEEAP